MLASGQMAFVRPPSFFAALRCSAGAGLTCAATSRGVAGVGLVGSGQLVCRGMAVCTRPLRLQTAPPRLSWPSCGSGDWPLQGFLQLSAAPLQRYRSRRFCSSSDEGEEDDELAEGRAAKVGASDSGGTSSSDEGSSDGDGDSDDEEGATLFWSDHEDIAEKLFEAHSTEDPLAIRFADLQARICNLPDFADRPERCDEGKLEAIQLAWLELYEDENGPSPSRHS